MFRSYTIFSLRKIFLTSCTLSRNIYKSGMNHIYFMTWFPHSGNLDHPWVRREHLSHKWIHNTNTVTSSSRVSLSYPFSYRPCSSLFFISLFFISYSNTPLRSVYLSISVFIFTFCLYPLIFTRFLFVCFLP